MGAFSLKIKTKKGQHILTDLTENATIGCLKNRISDITSIPANQIGIRIGFPPQPLDVSQNDVTLSSSKITNGDTLIVDEKAAETIPVPQSASVVGNRTTKEQTSSENDESAGPLHENGILLKKVVPSDNSCLFTSIGFALNGNVNPDCAPFMREVIAQHVANDKETYSEALLGKPNEEYCKWIKQSDTWGGAIEVSILSSYYGFEIDVVDITNEIINRFGEDKNYGLRIFLLFDGIHYDALYLELFNNDKPKTMFAVDDANVFQQAEQLAKEAKLSRQFTDVNKFTLKCIQCDSFLTGQVEAQQHAKATGHTNFGEV